MKRATFILSIKQYCINYARKTGQIDNMSDCKGQTGNETSDPMVLKVHDRAKLS